jgi:hypothetical protein
MSITRAPICAGQRALTVGTYLACIVLTLVVSLWKGKVPLRGLILMALVACQASSLAAD